MKIIIYETGLALLTDMSAFFKEMAEQILKILVSGERQIYPPGLHAAFLHLTPGVTGPSTFKLINSAAICWPQGRHHCVRKSNYIKELQKGSNSSFWYQVFYGCPTHRDIFVVLYRK